MSESASRIEPSAARAIIASASASARDVLLAEHALEPRADLGGADALEVEPLQAAQHRRGGLRDLLRLGRGEDEHDARRRLLEDLEQRVPRLAREHVRLVHDVDLVPIVAGGRVHRALAQLARVVDAAVRRGVDLDDVERRGAAPDALAARALPARLAVERGIAATLAVERHGEHARERRLAHAARPAQQVAVRHASARDRPLERRRDVRLHGDVGEGLRAVLPGESEGMGRR